MNIKLEITKFKKLKIGQQIELVLMVLSIPTVIIYLAYLEPKLFGMSMLVSAFIIFPTLFFVTKERKKKIK